jgi:hypothetical protein
MNLLTQETCSRPDDIRFIPLSRGLFARVSAKDYERVSQFKWSARWSECTHSFYAFRNMYLGGGRKNTKRREVSMARFILGLEFGDKRWADHIDHNTLDNTRENLRISTCRQQQQNRRGSYKGSSKYKGVSWRSWKRGGGGGKWIARIVVDDVRLFLGYFETEEEAAEAYAQAAIKFHGEFACLEKRCPPK